MNANGESYIKIVPILHSEDGYYLSFSGLVKESDIDAAMRTYTQRFGAPPAEVRYNEKARLHEFGPVDGAE